MTILRASHMSGQVRPVNRPVFLLNPEGFDPRDYLPRHLHPRADHARYIVHLILTRTLHDRRWRDLGEPGPRLKSEHFRRMIGQGYYEDIKRALVAAGAIRVDEFFIPGEKSLCFDLDPDLYRNAAIRRHEVTDRTLARKIREHRRERDARCVGVHAKLARKLTEIDMDADAARAALEALDPADHVRPGDREGWFDQWRKGAEVALEAMTDPDLDERYYGPCEHGRFHSAITNMPGGMRGYLRHGGAPLVSLDLANSQPLILAGVMRDQLGRALPDDAREFLESCEAGTLYDELMGATKGGDDRNAFKRRFFGTVVYCKPEAMRGPISDAFRGRFPTPWTFIRDSKRDNYAALAHRMQRKESELVIGRAAARFLDERPEAPLATVHDSFLTTAEHAGRAEAILREEFGRAGLRPQIRATACEPSLSPSVKDRRPKRQRGKREASTH